MSLQRWADYLNGLPTGHSLHRLILDSWERCIAAGIEPHTGSVAVRRVPAEELKQRLVANAVLIQEAEPHLKWLSESLSEVPHVAYLVDRDGIILQAFGAQTDLDINYLSPGHDWSERSAGTNGAGTAIAANRPVAIIGSEHLVKSFHRFTCTGAPLHDAAGNVIGAIDVSTGVTDGKPERLLAVAHAAFAIDRQLVHREAAEARDQRQRPEGADRRAGRAALRPR